MYICIYVYISPNSFRARVPLSKIPCLATVFCARHRGKRRFSVEIHNTIEEVRAKVAKVSCFVVPFEGSGVSAPEREHYRGWWHLACQFPRGSGNFFSDVLRSRAVALPFLSSTVIYDTFVVQCSNSRNTIADMRPRLVDLP